MLLAGEGGVEWGGVRWTSIRVRQIPDVLVVFAVADEAAAASAALDDYSDNDLGRYMNPVK